MGKIVLQINKKLLLEDGPWDAQKRADIQHGVNMDTAMSNTYDNHKLHYGLNPFVAGPISHGIQKITNGVNNLGYSVIKDTDSAAAPSKANVTADSNQGVWNAQMDVAGASQQGKADAYDAAKASDPVQAMLNPFVGGGISTAIENQRAAAFKNGRIIGSPSTQAGSTLN